jgi:hypothetical protein
VKGACSDDFATASYHKITRKYMHAETLALLTKLLCFPNMKYCHGKKRILRIVLKLKNPPKISLLVTK